MRPQLKVSLSITLGVLVSASIWFGVKMLNPLKGSWESEDTICNFGPFGGIECADKMTGMKLPATVNLNNKHLSIGCYSGKFELLPSNEALSWHVQERLAGCEPPTPSWLTSAQNMARSNGTYLGDGTYRRLKELFADNKLDAAGQVVEANLRRARFGRGNIIRMGVPDEGEDLAIEQIAAVLEGDSYGKELETAAALEALALVENRTFPRECYLKFTKR